MLRNKAITVLQKAYDDSYLSCSTAAYYESQGDEAGAMRHWRNALRTIYEYNATKLSHGWGSPINPERSFANAMRELELQSKERIDILEALRVSRQHVVPSSSSHISRQAHPLDSNSVSKGSIGQGTVPAIAWSELPRPLPLNRPSTVRRSFEDDAIKSCNLSAVPSTSSGSSPSRSRSSGSSSRQSKVTQTSSPNKSTLKTTLRSGGKRDKPLVASCKSQKAGADEPSKAATLAWSAVVPRGPVHDGNTRGAVLSRSVSRPSKSRELISKPHAHWDDHSSSPAISPDAASGFKSITTRSNSRHSDKQIRDGSPLSTTAALSALNPSYHEFGEKTSNNPMHDGGSESISVVNPAHGPPASQQAQEPGTEQSPSNPRWNSRMTEAPAWRNITTEHPTQTGSRSDQDIDRVNQRRRPKLQGERLTTHSSGDVAAATKVLRIAEQGAPGIRNERKVANPAAATTHRRSPEGAMGSHIEPLLRNLPPSVDRETAKQILNDIIVQGDEVHWGDIAGLDIAKNALRETVVYPFLRPDLFMGLREPARGMLLFGPPGTGKTMLARAVATESKSTFFAISASSLTSKYVGESERLVKTLFWLARALAPSIIFVDEIDSILSQRSSCSGEHEASRRLKTEFLIQWSDLQRAAVGRVTTNGENERENVNSVLVLAATNLPWAIDEAARRRFVRRQYIPLPEPRTREIQFCTLLGQQKHSLSKEDIDTLVNWTGGFSGSDITALAKDAAMGPLRSLGEAVLRTTMDEIRPIMLSDFEKSLKTIRPSVSHAGLRKYDEWAREFGERGG